MRPILIADLQSQEGAPATLLFHDIELCLRVHASEIQGYYHLPPSRELPHPLSRSCWGNDAKYIKALTKGLKNATRALELVSYNGGPSRAAKINFTGRALVGGRPCEGRALVVEGITSFEEIRFEFPLERWSPSAQTSSHYLHFSSTVRQIAPGLLLHEDGKSDFTNVTILSGVCLFSARIMQSSTPDNQRLDVEKLRYSRPTLYEVEYIARAAPVIADFAALLDTNVHLIRNSSPFSSGLSLGLCLDVPSFHYYHSLDGRLRNNSCTFAEAIQWMDEVQKRHVRISSVFRNYIVRELARRGSTLERQIQVSPFSDVVSSIIRKFLEKEELPSLDSVLRMMSSEIQVWTRFYNLVPEKERPQDFRALGYLFYVFQVVQPALMGSPPTTPPMTSPSEVHTGRHNSVKRAIANPGKLLISIDDAGERRIYSRAQDILKKSNTMTDYQTATNLLEVYMCRRVFINGNAAGSNIYFDDPSSEIPSPVRGACNILRENQTQERGCSNVMDPFDIVSSLYGLDAAEILAELFMEVGLSL